MFVITGIRYIRVLFTVLFTITGLKNIVRYTGVFFISGFPCNEGAVLTGCQQGGVTF